MTRTRPADVGGGSRSAVLRPAASAVPDRPDLGRRVFAARIIARALDAAIVFWLVFIASVTHLAFWIPLLSDRFDGGPWGHNAVVASSFAVTYTAYDSTFSALRRQTPGEEIARLGSRALGDSKRGQTARLVARAALHGAAWVIPGLALACCVQFVVSCLPVFGSGRTLVERLTGTRVERRTPTQASERPSRSVASSQKPAQVSKASGR